MSTLSVETWKLMVARLAGDEEATQYICPLLMRYITSVKKTQPLTTYVQPLVSNTFEFLAHLTITGQPKGNTHELIQLVQLKNLAVFEFIRADEEDELWSILLTDSILREWSKMPDPFPVLRVLRIWANDCTTTHSLRYINAFPSLVLYDVAGKKRDWAERGEKSVWKSRKRTWAVELDHTIDEHFHLLEEDITDNQWKRGLGSQRTHLTYPTHLDNMKQNSPVFQETTTRHTMTYVKQTRACKHPSRPRQSKACTLPASGPHHPWLVRVFGVSSYIVISADSYWTETYSHKGSRSAKMHSPLRKPFFRLGLWYTWFLVIRITIPKGEQKIWVGANTPISIMSSGLTYEKGSKPSSHLFERTTIYKRKNLRRRWGASLQNEPLTFRVLLIDRLKSAGTSRAFSTRSIRCERRHNWIIGFY